MEENQSVSGKLLTQEEVERQMYYGGIKRAETMMRRAEEAGAADRNPYSSAILNDYVLPIAAAIREDLAKPGAARRRAHVALLEGLDLAVVAFLSARVVINACFDPREDANERVLGYKIGATVNSELVLGQIATALPDLYHTLSRDLGRRMSKNERHRMTVMRLQAKQAGLRWVDWPRGSREQIGSYLLGLMVESGMLEMADSPEVDYRSGKPSVVPRPITLAPGLLERVAKIKGFVALTSPVYGPCVERPLPWTSMSGGGFHTPELRRTLPLVVRCHPAARPYVREAHPQTFLDAVNCLQDTRWAVNKRVLEAVRELSAAGVETDEIVTMRERPRPAKPAWLVPGFDKNGMTEEQSDQFHKWKRQTAEWHTSRKLLGAKFSRFYSATRSADMFADYPAIHYVYFADSRGRLYPLTYGINPQGSDLQKALVRFADGAGLHTESALRWFHVHGANKYGFDKATLSERFMWAHTRREWLLGIAADPINNRDWVNASSPLQFLAWCFEYADWVADPEGFKSHLPISMDGSCNGLQHLSALRRDEIGGRATNLLPSEEMQDVYGEVAKKTAARLSQARYTEQDEVVRAKWCEHGVSRSVVKRAVMTTPYGVTKRSATDYVVEDYLKKTATPFERTEFRAAARVLMDHGWAAIGDVVVKGRLCMEWLSKGARAIVKNLPDDAPIITWATPSGFPASQAYFKKEEYRVRTLLAGVKRLLVSVEESPEPSPHEHGSGLAPNFVHSMDAAHLHRVAARCSWAGLQVAMIHDDYGTHAADADTLYRIIREEFVAMYEERDPAQELFDKYQEMGPPPEMGSMDIRAVLDSPFFFS